MHVMEGIWWQPSTQLTGGCLSRTAQYHNKNITQNLAPMQK